jgi:hypothetical protein
MVKKGKVLFKMQIRFIILTRLTMQCLIRVCIEITKISVGNGGRMKTDNEIRIEGMEILFK